MAIPPPRSFDRPNRHKVGIQQMGAPRIQNRKRTTLLREAEPGRHGALSSRHAPLLLRSDEVPHVSRAAGHHLSHGTRRRRQLRGWRDAVTKAPGFRELTHFTIVTYGPFALREGVTAPRRSTPTGSDRTLLLECRLQQLPSALDEAPAQAHQARLRL